MKYLTTFLFLALLAVPCLATADAPAQAETVPAVEQAAPAQAAAVVELPGTVFQADLQPNGSCYPACTDACDTERDACIAGCGPPSTDWQCYKDCNCAQFFCHKACGCEQDPPPGGC